MKEWFNSLSQREQSILVAGGAVVAILLLYALVWHPVTQEIRTLRTTVAQDRADLLWMRHAAVRATQLQQAATVVPGSGRPLLTLVEQTARQSGLGDAVKRVEPQGSGRAGVWLEQAGFDDLIRWVDGLNRNQNVDVESIRVDPQSDDGRVNARLVLSQGAAS